MEVLQTVFFFIVALMILVGVHEFGHFYVARLCGVKVLRFCIGMGTPFWSVRDKKGTEFGIAPFPLGGYVKMLDEREVDVPPEQKHLSYNSKSVAQRIAILSAGPLANFILAFLIFWLFLWFQGVSVIKPVVNYVDAGSLADQAGIEVGQEIVAIDGVPTPSKQAVLERLLFRLGESGTMQLTMSEPDSDLRYDTEIELDGWLKDALDPDPEAGFGVIIARPDIYISEVLPDGAAAEAGLQAQDKLVQMNGRPIRSYRDWINTVKVSASERLQLEIARATPNGNTNFQVEVIPKATQIEDGTTIGRVGVMVGFGPTPPELVRHIHYGPLESMPAAVLRLWDMSKFVLISMKKLVVGEISTKNLSGPIGIAKVAGDYAKAGVPYFIEFLAILSIYLGVLNLLPIPILDGGHILYCLIEGVKGSPLSQRVQNMGYSAGLVVLAGVMVVAFYNDILKL